MNDSQHFKLHPDDEGVDAITISIVPRFKTSSISGDEWRVSARIAAYRKGELVGEKFVSKMKSAASALPYFWMTLYDWCNGPLYDGARGGRCQQAGCGELATVTYRLKQEYSARGEGPLPPSYAPQFRRFCDKHAVRGDCGLEDADDNYELVSGHPANRGDIPLKDISPSQQVAVEISDPADIADAVKAVHEHMRAKGSES